MKKFAIIIALGLMASTAMAGITNVDYQVHNGKNLHVHAPVGNLGAQQRVHTNVGLFEFDVKGTGTVNGQTEFYTFCVDLDQYVYQGQDYNFVDPSSIPTPDGDTPYNPMGSTRAAYLAELFGEHYHQLFDGPNDATDRQGFQLAVWEIVYEDLSNSFSATGGDFWVEGDAGTARDRANDFLSTIDGDGPTLRLLGLENAVDGGAQDFVTVIPIPGAVLLGVLGLGLVARVKRHIA